MGKRQPIIVDGANVAYVEQSQKGLPKVGNIVAVRNVLLKKQFDPVIFVDASLVHEIDDPDQLEAMIDSQTVRQVPAGTDADYFILETADRMGAKVVSNDRFEPYQEQYGWIQERRVPLMIVNGEVELYLPQLERKGK